VLHYEASIRPAAAFDDDLPDTEVTATELKLAKNLIDATRAKEPSLEDYHNVYNDRLTELVEAKVAGREIARPASEDRGPPTINIIEALKASIEKNKPRRPGSGRVIAANRARPKAPAKRRKSG
jgi:DNA end-binding protein Ku